MAGQGDYRSAMIALFREAFEGIPEGQNYTWFVQGKQGIFDAIESTASEDASKRPTPDCNSIGAHLNHLRYALWLANAETRGEAPQSDWEGSWSKQAFDPDEWRQLGLNLRREYEGVLNWMESKPDLSDSETMIGAFAQIAHAAYHLGSIRQLIKVV